jgi:hypothetical protein
MNNDGKEKEVEFITISAEKIDFGRNNFIEVARKRAKTNSGEENEFISLSRGYYVVDGNDGTQEKRAKFKKSVTIPDDPKIKEFVIERIKTL